MAKPKRGAARGGTHKKHGPKRKLFHYANKCMRTTLGQLGALTKFVDFESFTLACQARGVKNVTEVMWNEFHLLPTMQAKREWFANLKK